MNPAEEQVYHDFLRRLATCDHVDRLIEVGNWNSAANELGLDYGIEPEVIRDAAKAFRQFINELADLRSSRDSGGYWRLIKQRLSDEQVAALDDYLARRDVLHQALELEADSGKIAELCQLFGTDEERLMGVVERYGYELRRLGETVDRGGYRLPQQV